MIILWRITIYVKHCREQWKSYSLLYQIYNQQLFQTWFPKRGTPYRRQVVNPRHQTPQGQSVAKPGTPRLVLWFVSNWTIVYWQYLSGDPTMLLRLYVNQYYNVKNSSCCILIRSEDMYSSSSWCKHISNNKSTKTVFEVEQCKQNNVGSQLKLVLVADKNIDIIKYNRIL